MSASGSTSPTSLIDRLRSGVDVARAFGLRWTVRRLVYEGQLRLGWHRLKMPRKEWGDIGDDAHLRDGADPEAGLAGWRSGDRRLFPPRYDREAYARALRSVYRDRPEVLAGLEREPSPDVRFFSHAEVEVDPATIWYESPLVGAEDVPRDRHWSEYPMHDEGYVDLKFAWEYGRFAVVYRLCRSYTLTGDEEYAELFWELVEAWAEHNPPHTGPHWKCGQEISLRLMAWFFGLHVFRRAEATTPERYRRFLERVAVQVDRVSRDYHYSFLQHSNHAVSEGLGLYVTGLLFPELARADEWKRLGRKILEERSEFLIRPDGTYIQKSHNYLRFVLHAYLYVVRVAEAHDEELGETMMDRLRAAVDYLQAVLDRDSGRVPNFGSNDGALILPLDGCDYRDFRPVLAAWVYQLHGTRMEEEGCFHEDLLWLFGPEALSAPVRSLEEPRSRRFPRGGIYTLRGSDGWVFTHAEEFQDRPAHADALHVDLWWRGQNIAIDAGTYLYYGLPPWKDPYKLTKPHNTVTVDGLDQMVPGMRFTWGKWHGARLVAHAHLQDRDLEYLELEHDGYRRLSDPVTHRRAIIRLGGEAWAVVDDLVGSARHELRLHWLLADLPYVLEGERLLRLEADAGEYCVDIHGAVDELDVVRGGETTGTRGFVSEFYADRSPCVSVAATTRTELPGRLVTVFAPAEEIGRVEVAEDLGAVAWGGTTVDLEEVGAATTVHRVVSRRNQRTSQ